MLSREGLLKFTMTGNKDLVICRYCNESYELAFPFVPYRAMNGDKKFMVKNRQHEVRLFLEKHFGLHSIQEKRKLER